MSAPTFPNGVWDGTSANKWRLSRTDSVDPNQADWDRIVSEMISTQEVVLGLLNAGQVLSTLADEEIAVGQLVRLTTEGRLALASYDDPAITGMSLQDVAQGGSGSYLRRGVISLANWSQASGSVSLQPGSDYFLGANGLLSLTAPQSGFVIRVGQALSPTTFDLAIGQPVRL